MYLRTQVAMEVTQIYNTNVVKIEDARVCYIGGGSGTVGGVIAIDSSGQCIPRSEMSDNSNNLILIKVYLYMSSCGGIGGGIDLLNPQIHPGDWILPLAHSGQMV